MKVEKVYVCGLMLNPTKKKLERLLTCLTFNFDKLLLVVNKDFVTTNPKMLFIHERVISESAGRYHKMAILRNQYLDEIKKVGSDGDIVVVIDTDNLLKKTTFAHFDRIKSKVNEGFVLTGYSKPYYDLVALRMSESILNDVWRLYNVEKDIFGKFGSYMRNIFFPMRLNVSQDYTEVLSAFNGVMMLPFEKIRSDTNYICNNDICEHVNFVMSLSPDCKGVLISAYLEVNSPMEHTSILYQIFKLLKRKLL